MLLPALYLSLLDAGRLSVYCPSFQAPPSTRYSNAPFTGLQPVDVGSATVKTAMENEGIHKGIKQAIMAHVSKSRRSEPSYSTD